MIEQTNGCACPGCRVAVTRAWAMQECEEALRYGWTPAEVALLAEEWALAHLAGWDSDHARLVAHRAAPDDWQTAIEALQRLQRAAAIGAIPAVLQPSAR